MSIEIALTGEAVATPSGEMTEQRLGRLLSENEAALRRLVASYARPHERDDLLQEIAIALWRALPRFRGDCSERTFLFRIAHNRCITHISRRREHQSLDELALDPADPRSDTEKSINAEQEHNRLFGAVVRLPVMYREVIVLMLEGLDYREISEVVGTTENNVGVRLNRARRKLKKILEEQP